MSFFFTSRRRHTRYWRDWSSDVCSSDLGPRGDALGAGLRAAGAEPIVVRPGDSFAATATGYRLRPGVRADHDELVAAQIGRASCRERVQISVVAVSLKKNSRRSAPRPRG